jgi:molecular chaperone HscB
MQNFFDIFGLSTDYALDPVALEKAYFAAQRATHPDLAVGKPEDERVEAFLKSQLVNEAYEVLKNPLSRAEHMLALKNIFVNDENHTKVPPELLMEMMELRERLQEASGSGVELNAVLGEIKSQATECGKTLTNAFTFNNTTVAAAETTRLAYLIKAIEEAHMLIYRLKAQAAHS